MVASKPKLYSSPIYRLLALELLNSWSIGELAQCVIL